MPTSHDTFVPTGPNSPECRAETTAAPPAFAEAARVWARVGWLSFGGPTAQIALMHRTLVEERRWLTDEQFLSALGFCMLLPGPEAMQLATWAGWRMHGVRGGLVAGLLFVLPGALVVLALAWIDAAFGALPPVAAAFRGIQAAVLMLVVEALVRIGRRALARRRHVVVAALSFVAMVAFAVPFPLVIAAAGLLGALLPPPGTASPPAPARARGSLAGTARTMAAWLAIWWLPLLGVALVFGRDHILWQLAWFFSKLAMVTFGGAYAALAYMSQDVVTHHGWLTARQMLDGLGLAETTPGPLILVTEFVGFFAAVRANPGQPWMFGVLGAAVALWATFAPCFLWIFAGAPHLERLVERGWLKSALAWITAAVLGVMLNLSVWFAVHVWFARVDRVQRGALQFAWPQFDSVQPVTIGLTLVSAVLLLRLRWSVHRVLFAMAALSLLLSFAGR